ncbi:MAG: MtrB/PioB family outer membrane beta-barrel protein [Nitrospirae bacterium]|nr:MtrB/PioB family outer membrane beta-barrel protein [Nitrospirota bacterium]
MKIKIQMKAKIAILAIFLILLPFSVAFAQDEGDSAAGSACGGGVLSGPGCLKVPNLSGEVSTRGQIVGINGNPSKFNEYRDVASGVYGAVKLKYDDDSYWFKFKASDIGYDTQNYRLDGGIYGAVKYYVEYNEIPHNYSLGDRIIYSGAGTNNMTLLPANTKQPFTSMNNLDYAIKRQQEGGGVRLDMAKPFYAEFSGSREDRTGTRPFSATSNGSSGPLTELPQPIDYVTETFRGELGYITKALFASAYLQYTDFDNANQNLYFPNVYGGTLAAGTSRLGLTDTLTLPPDNQNYDYGFRGSADLILARLNVSLSGGQTTSGANLLNSSIMGGNTTAGKFNLVNYTYGNGASTWHGKMDNENYNFVLTSNPVACLDVTLFEKYYDRRNKSDVISITPSIAQDFHSGMAPLSYRKNDFGGELGYKLPANFALTAGYDYVNAHRTTTPTSEIPYSIPKTDDNIYSVSLKWTGLDFLAAKAGYERMNRKGANDSGLLAIQGEGDGNPNLSWYKNEFDIGSQHRDKYKVSLDLFPTDSLNVGLGYNYIRSTYPDTVIGLRSNTIDEYFADADYTFGHFAKLNGYVAYENIKQYNFQRNGNSAPDGPTQTSSNYNWDVTLKDNSFDWGGGLDIYVIPRKVTLRVQYDYVKSDGNADFTILNQAALTALSTPTAAIPTGQNNSNLDVPTIDNCKKSSILAKAMWDVTKYFSVVVGYAFEHYKYNDAGYDNYPSSYILADDNTSTPKNPINYMYLTGAYANPSYNASLAFLTFTYKF